MAISPQDKDILVMRSGGMCGMCKRELVKKGIKGDKPNGEMAHIKGNKPGSARHDPDLEKAEKDSYRNLFYLCGDCHSKIDKDPNTYPADVLYNMKAKHEADVEGKLKEVALKLTYFELDHILRHLTRLEYTQVDETLQVIPPKAKINKNNLSSQVEQLLQVGLLQNKDIEDFLNENADMNYSEKIRSYFVNKYLEIKQTGLNSDRLFYALWSAVNDGNMETRYTAAALSVLSYYFYLCEVFER